MVHTSQVERLGRACVKKFKEHVDRQMFEVVIQAAAGRRIVARETIKPFRKDVLQKLHASDVSRRRKLLEAQKEGRKKLKGLSPSCLECVDADGRCSGRQHCHRPKGLSGLSGQVKGGFYGMHRVACMVGRCGRVAYWESDGEEHEMWFEVNQADVAIDADLYA